MTQPSRHRWRWLVGRGLFFSLLLMPLAARATPASFQDIEESLTCQCGCGLTVHSCNHLQCGSALPLREEIREQMKLGKDKEAILAYFSAKYGEKILSSPTTSGFNLVAWITPFALLGVGGVFVAIVVVRWSSRGQATPHDTVAPPRPAGSTPYEQILEKELKEFDS